MSPLRRLNSFQEAQDGWMRLLPRCSSNTIFLTPQWQWSWSQKLGHEGELLLLALEDDGVKGIAPLLKRGGTITFIGDPDVYDYCDFLVLPGAEREFYSALLQYLKEEEWEELYFFSLPHGSPTLLHLSTMAEEAGYRVEQEKEDVCPGLHLPPSWDEYLTSLSKKDRHELRRKLRRLDRKENVRWYYCSSPTDLNDHMDNFFDLLRQSRESKRSFLTPNHASFFRIIAEQMALKDMLRLFFLEMDGERVASTLCFDYGPSRLLYNSGFNPHFRHYSVGLMLTAYCLKDAIENGKSYFDFLRGPEPYKYHLGAKDRTVYQIRVTRQ